MWPLDHFVAAAAETEVTFGKTLIGWDGFSVFAYSACLQNVVASTHV